VEVIQPGIPVFTILAEAEPSFVSAVFLAARAAGLTLNGLAMNSETDPIQLLWDKKLLTGRHAARKPLPPDANYARKALREILEKHGERMPYLHLHTEVLAFLAEKGMLNWSDEMLSALEKTVHIALANPEFVDLESRSTPETGSWALKKWGQQPALKGL